MDDLINLASFDKNKEWIIFYKKGCCNCFTTKKYFEAKGIKHDSYDIDTRDGLSMAASYDVIKECEVGVPVIIEKKPQENCF